MTLDERVAALREAGMSVSEIAREVGRPESTISKHLRHLGYGSAAARGDVTSEAVLAAWNAGLSVGEIATRFECSYDTVERRLVAAGVVRKNKKSAGSRVMGRDEFVRRAESVHGARYDYSRVEYVNSKTKVEIVCSVHGPFWQAPEKHLAGRGCPHRECVAARTAETNLRNFGVERPLQSAAVRETMRATNVERYGVEHVTRSPEILAKIAATNVARRGVTCNLRTPEAVAAAEARHGGPSPFCSPEIRAKAAATMIRRYGVDNPMRVPEFKVRFGETCEARYGFRWPLSSSAVRDRIRATMRERHGVDYSFQAVSLRAKSRATCVLRYGGPNPMCSRGVVNKVSDAKRRNGTFHTSSSEDALYAMLVERFGADDVVRQYRAPEYDFACDFYVKSRDLRVELNASWTHGGHWFDQLDAEDAAVVRTWMERAASSEYYVNAIQVWTGADVRKREAARSGGLNYVVFWDNDLSDAWAWFAAGCPDGRDWDEPWSWLGIEAGAGSEFDTEVGEACGV